MPRHAIAHLETDPVRERIPVFDAAVSETAKRHVNEVLESGWVSSAGPMVGLFEQAFADRVGVRNAVSTSSGTTALHLALALLDLQPGDEVIVPDFTMFATVCAVLYTGATPVFVDVDPLVGTLNPDLVEAAVTSRTRVILPVHIYGHSADMDAIRRVADAHDLWVLEDAAEAHGARYRGRACGSLGDLAAFSFYANKIISTGEGGMLTTDDDALAARARSLRNLAHRPGARFVHDELGFSYRMGSLAAALGLGQLEHLDEFLAHRRWMANAYAERLGSIAGLHLPTSREWADNVHWMYAVRIEHPARLTRDAFAAALARCGIESRPFFKSCSTQPVVVGRMGPQPSCPVSEHLAATGLYLPSGLALTAVQLDAVCDAVQRLIG
jgi:perosamine synthetase